MSTEELELNDIQGLPRQLNAHLKIYPVMLKDTVQFMDSLVVLNIPKNSIRDVEIMKMSYLKFLLILSSTEQNKDLRDKLHTLLRLIFRTENIDLGVKYDGHYLSLSENPNYIFLDNIRCVIKVNDYEMSEKMFNKIKTVVSEQNMVDLEDDNVHPETRKKLQEAREFMNKRGGKPAPLVQRILSYEYESGKPIDKIMEMTIYQFNRSLEVIAHIKNSDTAMLAMASGMAKPKDGKDMPNWLSAIERIKEDPLKLDADKLTQNMKSTFG